MNSENARYFSRSWKMLTRHKGWVKPVLVLALVQVVPIVGALALLGFSLEWARLSAWGIDSSPKQRGVRVGECIASGWRGFLVIVAWMIPWGVLMWLLQRITGSSSSDFLSLLFSIATIVVAVVAYAAAVRAAVYAKISAGLKVVRVIGMMKRDPKGLFKIALIPLVATVITIVLVVLAAVVFLLTSMGSIMELVNLAAIVYYSNGVSSSVGAQMLLLIGEMLGVVLVLLVVFGYPVAVVQTASALLEVNSVGLWMAQFDVPHWGGSNDPLPETSGLPAPDPSPVPPVQDSAPAAPVEPAPTAEPASPTPAQAAEPVGEPAPAQAAQPVGEPVPAAPAPDPMPGVSKPAAVVVPEQPEQGELQLESQQEVAEQELHESSTDVLDFAESEGAQASEESEE